MTVIEYESKTYGDCQDVITDEGCHLDAEPYLTEYLVTPGIVEIPRAVPIGVLVDGVGSLRRRLDP